MPVYSVGSDPCGDCSLYVGSLLCTDGQISGDTGFGT